MGMLGPNDVAEIEGSLPTTSHRLPTARSDSNQARTGLSKLPLSISFHQIQTIGIVIAMATAAPQVLDLMNTLANASEEHVEEIIKALKALPQCIKASAEATKMRTTSGVKKSPSKKGRAKQQHGMGDEVYAAITQQTFTTRWTQRSPVIAFAGADLLRTFPSTPEKKVNLARHLTPGHWTRGKLLNTHTPLSAIGPEGSSLGT